MHLQYSMLWVEFVAKSSSPVISGGLDTTSAPIDFALSKFPQLLFLSFPPSCCLSQVQCSMSTVSICILTDISPAASEAVYWRQQTPCPLTLCLASKWWGTKVRECLSHYHCLSSHVQLPLLYDGDKPITYQYWSHSHLQRCPDPGVEVSICMFFGWYSMLIVHIFSIIVRNGHSTTGPSLISSPTTNHGKTGMIYLFSFFLDFTRQQMLPNGEDENLKGRPMQRVAH